MAGSVTSLVKKIVDVKEDSSTGLPIFVHEDGSQVKIKEGDIVESLRPERPDKWDAIISFFFPKKGIEMLAGTFIEAGMNFIRWSTNICGDYGIPNRLDEQCGDIPGSERYSWPSREENMNWEKTVATPEGQNYSFRFRFSIGVPGDYAPDPNSWLLYVRDLSTTSSEISYFYLRLNLFGSVYIDIPKLRTGDKLLVKIPKDVFKKSGYSLSNVNSLLSSMKIEATGYQSDWFSKDDVIATASELSPVVRALPPSRTVDPGSTFDIDFIISDTSLIGIKDLDTNTLKVTYNDNDITHVFIEGIVGGQFPYSYYVDTSDRSEQDRRYVVVIKNVTFSSGTHEVELSISDKQGHSASENVVYTVQTQLSVPTGFSASVNGSTVNLSWDAVSGASGYKLYYGTSSGNYIGSADLGSGTSYVINNVPAGTYYLALTAYNSAGESRYSNEVNITISQDTTGVVPGDMVRVPAGEFTMGSEEGYSDERPVHSVYLDEFYIDKYEVTNVQYKKCVEASGCSLPSNQTYYDNSAYAQHPVVFIDWYQARTYCQWAGKRLPTEAEWEKAARGTDGRKYPWGNEAPDAGGQYRANYYVFINVSLDGYQYTAPVGSFPTGASPYGAMDMAGNVWEWVADWYDGGYYSRSPYRNPQGPGSGEYRVLRGGSWGSYAYYLRAAYHPGYRPDRRFLDGGCRCAQDR